MRSAYGRRQLLKKIIQSRKSRKNLKKLEDWDFIPANRSPIKMALPMFLMDNQTETPTERFERYNRQLIRAISSCSLCPNGLKTHSCKHLTRDPHYTQSAWHKDIALLKYQPDISDVDRGLFSNIIPTLNAHNLKLDDFYITSIIKCPSQTKTNIKCPYWELEWMALNPVCPKLWVILDKKSADHLRINYDIGKFAKLNTENYVKAFCTSSNHSSFKTILKIIANPQLHKHLFPS